MGTGSLGGFCTPKMGFLRFSHVIFEIFKIIFLPLDSAQKTTQFSILKFFSISNGFRDIQKSKHSTLYLGGSNVYLMEDNENNNNNK
jgi:hypothetical protein